MLIVVLRIEKPSLALPAPLLAVVAAMKVQWEDAVDMVVEATEAEAEAVVDMADLVAPVVQVDARSSSITSVSCSSLNPTILCFG